MNTCLTHPRGFITVGMNATLFLLQLFHFLQATFALLQVASASKEVDMQVKKQVLHHFAIGARFASFIPATDILEHITVSAYNMTGLLSSNPGALSNLLEPLQSITNVLNTFPIQNSTAQVTINHNLVIILV